MTAAEAAKLLDLGVDATPEQLETRFQELRRRLEEKIAKAPTPGLQAKYRASLAEVTVAFETLTLAADASLLPMLNRGAATAGNPAGATVGTAAPVTAAAAPVPPPRPAAPRKAAHGKEFALVALIAVLVLAAGGWYVMKVRAEKAERVRIETEERIAAELAAKEAAEKAAAEADRVARLGTQLRTAMAEQRVNWEAIENKARDFERRASELKSELRGLRDGPATKKAELSALAHRHALYSERMNGYLARHPAKLARARAEEFLNAKAFDDAVAAVEEMQQETSNAEEAFAVAASAILEATGSVTLESTPAGMAFRFTDTYGHVHEGRTPATLTGLPVSHIHDPQGDTLEPVELKVGEFTVVPTARFSRLGWEDVVSAGQITPETTTYRGTFPESTLEVTSSPAGLAFEVTNKLGWKSTGKTPAKVAAVPPGAVTVRTSRPNYKDVSATATVEAGKPAKLALDHRAQGARIKVAEANAKIYVDNRLVGQGAAEVPDLVPGNHTIALELAGYNRFQSTFSTVQEVSTRALNYSFAQLANQNITCSSCKGAGSFNRSERCNTCGGDGRMRCYACNGGGKTYTTNYNPSTNRIDKIELNCFACGGRGIQNCNNGPCDRGRIRWADSCTTCGGDGRRSQLELQ